MSTGGIMEGFEPDRVGPLEVVRGVRWVRWVRPSCCADTSHTPKTHTTVLISSLRRKKVAFLFLPHTTDV